jgi:hypothetical protein
MVITDKQRDFLESLLFGRVWPEYWPDGSEQPPEDLNALDREVASQFIDVLLKQPKKAVSLGIPDGRYAIPMGKRNGKLVFHFYFVNTSRVHKGQYMLRLYGAPGNFRREKMTVPMQTAIADTIKKDPALHSQMFGIQLGICGICGSPLTDPESIARGIGPICFGKSGW